MSGPDGPVPSGQVTVYPASATDLETAPVLASDFTGSDGDYVVDTLPPGSYKIRFEASPVASRSSTSTSPTSRPRRSVAISTAAPVTVDATLARGKAITRHASPASVAPSTPRA